MFVHYLLKRKVLGKLVFLHAHRTRDEEQYQKNPKSWKEGKMMPNHGEPLICLCCLDLPPTALPKAGDSDGSGVEKSLLQFIFSLPSWALLPLAGPGHLCLCELLHTSKASQLGSGRSEGWGRKPGKWGSKEAGGVCLLVWAANASYLEAGLFTHPSFLPGRRDCFVTTALASNWGSLRSSTCLWYQSAQGPQGEKGLSVFQVRSEILPRWGPMTNILNKGPALLQTGCGIGHYSAIHFTKFFFYVVK